MVNHARRRRQNTRVNARAPRSRSAISNDLRFRSRNVVVDNPRPRSTKDTKSKSKAIRVEGAAKPQHNTKGNTNK